MTLGWLAYVALGATAGVLAGLLGIGGGIFMVPVLAMLFSAQGFPHAHLMHLALGTSMAAIVFTSISSLRTHQRHGAVLWPVVKTITPGILVGTALGTTIASRIPTRELAIFFTGFITFVALQMAANAKPKPSRSLPGTWGMVGVGGFIGALSALVAIGGGSLSVPFLTWCNVQVQKAIGTSAAIGFPLALSGTLGYILSGQGATDLPSGTLGYVYLPALLGLVPASFLTAPIGARLTHRLPVAMLKRIFAGILLLLAIKMAYGLLGQPSP